MAEAPGGRSIGAGSGNQSSSPNPKTEGATASAVARFDIGRRCYGGGGAAGWPVSGWPGEKESSSESV